MYIYVIRGSFTARTCCRRRTAACTGSAVHLFGKQMAAVSWSFRRECPLKKKKATHHRDRGPCRRQRPWQLEVIDSACQHLFARLEAWRAGAGLLNRARHLGPHDREDRCGRLRATALSATSQLAAGALANIRVPGSSMSEALRRPASLRLRARGLAPRRVHAFVHPIIFRYAVGKILGVECAWPPRRFLGLLLSAAGR